LRILLEFDRDGSEYEAIEYEAKSRKHAITRARRFLRGRRYDAGGCSGVLRKRIEPGLAPVFARFNGARWFSEEPIDLTSEDSRL
jgi:hypothetical protein